MGNWKNRDSKLQNRRNLKQQRKFYDSNVSTEKKRKTKSDIREQRQEKADEYDRFLDA